VGVCVPQLADALEFFFLVEKDTLIDLSVYSFHTVGGALVRLGTLSRPAKISVYLSIYLS